MRSFHEKAWAAYFDRIGLAWEYEAVTFRAAGRSYTPDFALLGRTLFVEIKAWGAKNINAFELCPHTLILIFGMPTRHYIRLKPAGADRFNPGHLKHWSYVYNALSVR